MLSTGLKTKPSQTRVGSFVETIVELDEAVAKGEIFYRKQDGSEIIIRHQGAWFLRLSTTVMKLTSLSSKT